MKDIKEFVCLGAIVDREGGDIKDIKNRLQKAHGGFQRLWKVLAAIGLGKRSKMCLFKT